MSTTETPGPEAGGFETGSNRQHETTDQRDPRTPRCDYRPRPAPVRRNPPVEPRTCEHPAVVRVLYCHGAGTDPKYRDRCLFHADSHLGPLVGAIWDPLASQWTDRDVWLL